MSVLDGLTEIKLASDPGAGINPATGYIFTWVEQAGGSYILKYKTSAGVVGNIGSGGSAVLSINSGIGINVDNTDPINPIVNVSRFDWMLQAGHRDLPSNGTEYNFSYGNHSAIKGVTMMRNGSILGMSVRIDPTRTAGQARYIVTKNNIDNDTVGQRVVIDGTSNSEGGVDNNRGFLIFPTPITYVAGDQIEVRAITQGWRPTSSDSTVLLHMQDIL